MIRVGQGRASGEFGSKRSTCSSRSKRLERFELFERMEL
jgi:hypothetical protein